jgi:hypothetical protein
MLGRALSLKNGSSENWTDWHTSLEGIGGFRRSEHLVIGNMAIGTVGLNRAGAPINFCELRYLTDCLSEDDVFYLGGGIHPGETLEVRVTPEAIGATLVDYYLEVRTSTATPEPARILLVGPSILGLCGFLLRRKGIKVT